MTRRRAVWALLALAVATLACSGAVWGRGTTASAVQDAVALSATGGQLAPGVGAGGLVIAAAALALALGRRIGSWLAAAVAALGGVLVTVSALGAPGRATTVLSGIAADQVGVGEVLDTIVTWWSWVAAGLGVLTVVVAVLAALAVPGWRGPSRRHEVPDAGAPGASPDPERAVDPGEAWDALSRGEDPT